MQGQGEALGGVPPVRGAGQRGGEDPGAAEDAGGGAGGTHGGAAAGGEQAAEVQGRRRPVHQAGGQRAQGFQEAGGNGVNFLLFG